MRAKILCLVIGATTTLCGVAAATVKEPIVVSLGDDGGKAIFWLESSMKRIYNRSAPGSPELSLLAARNGKIAFQACFRNDQTKTLTVECKVLGADDLRPQVRYVGMVPMHHLTPNTKLSELDGVEHVPGLVPDPLWPMTKVWIGPYESRSFWITLNVPPDAKPGLREFTVRMEMPNSKMHVDLPVKLDVADLVIQPRKDFPVIHWWRGEATWDFYKTGMFEDQRWWNITRAQLENMLAHGSDVVYVPMFFDRRETFRRPCQLLIVDEPQAGRYTFDWSRVKQFTDMCKQIGFSQFEWSHLWIYWGVENPVRVYRKQGDQFVMLWDPKISGFSDTFLNFLRQFLPEFKAFLDREGILEKSYFSSPTSRAAGSTSRTTSGRARSCASWHRG